METIVFHIDAFWTRDSSRANIKATIASGLLQLIAGAVRACFPGN